jgi:hypothetical protein
LKTATGTRDEKTRDENKGPFVASSQFVGGRWWSGPPRQRGGSFAGAVFSQALHNSGQEVPISSPIGKALFDKSLPAATTYVDISVNGLATAQRLPFDAALRG